MKAGTCVLKSVTSTGSAWPGGSYRTARLRSPSIESSSELIDSTLPAFSCWTKNGW
jgi:hypothetical protein